MSHVRVRTVAALAIAGTLAVITTGALMTAALPNKSGAALGAPPAPVVSHVHGTGALGVNLRTAPSTTARRVGWLPDGAPVQIRCWTTGTSVRGDPVWLEEAGTGEIRWIADRYVTTHWQHLDDLAQQGVPRCDQLATASGSSEVGDSAVAGVSVAAS